MTFKTAFFLVASFISISTVAAKPNGFYLNSMPKGKEITVPRNAITFLPLKTAARLSATDMPQTIKMKPINTANGPVSNIRLSIFDRVSDRVQYIQITPHTPYLYTFKNLETITVTPEAINSTNTSSMQLQVISDKPLSLGH